MSVIADLRSLREQREKLMAAGRADEPLLPEDTEDAWGRTPKEVEKEPK